MAGIRSFRLDRTLDERWPEPDARFRLVVRLVGGHEAVVSDSEVRGAAQPTSSDLSPTGLAYAADSSPSHPDDATLALTLARTPRNGLDLLVELHTGGQNGELEAWLERDRQHLAEADPDEKDGTRDERECLREYTAPSSDHGSTSHDDSSRAVEPRRVGRRGRLAVAIAAGIVLIGLVLRSSPAQLSDPASSQTATSRSTTATPLSYDAQWFAAVGAQYVPTSCAVG